MSTRSLDLAQHYLLDLGATMVGPFTLAGSPTSDFMAASKAYVDTRVAQGGGGGGGTGFPEAPTDGQFYGRRGQTSQWLPVPPLDGTGKVPASYLPAAQGTLLYKSGWNPTTNTPVLATGGLAGGVPAAKGDYYVALISGTASPAIDGITTVNAGDWIVSNGATWERQQNAAGIYLPLSGGTLTGALTAPQITVNSDLWGPAGLAVDLAYSWRDANGNVPLALAYDGSLLVAAVYPPFTPTMPVPKSYTDTTFLPIINAVAQASFTVPTASAFITSVAVDVAFGVQDATGQLPFMVDTAGNTWIASLRTLNPPNYASAVIDVLTYKDLTAATLTQSTDWLTGYTYDWTVSDGTHIAAALTHEGRLRTRLALETQSLDLSASTGFSQAYQLDPCVADIKVCGAGGGVQLTRARGGVWYVQNSHSSTIQVWPMNGAQLGVAALGSPVGVEPGSAVICWQVSLTKYGIAQAGAGGGGSMVYTATGASNPRDARDRAADTINVNDLVAGIDPTGVTDNSTQIRAAHDLALSLGYRYLWFPARSKINAPFGGAVTAPMIYQVIFIGEKCTINTFRKVIADPNGRSFVPPMDDLTPIQIEGFTAAVRAATTAAPARVLILGHSGVDANQRDGQSGGLTGLLKTKLAKVYGNRPIEIIDRSIGGTAWIDLAWNKAPGNAYGNDTGNPQWWAQYYETLNPGQGYTRRWMEYALDQQPVHAIFFCHGANDNKNFDIYVLETLLAEVRSRFNPVPAIFSIADYGRKMQDTSTGIYDTAQSMDYCAGYQRSYWRRNGVGFFDFGRGVQVATYGIDPVGGVLTNIIDGFAISDGGNNNQVTLNLPWTFPQSVNGGFSFRIGPAGNMNVLFGTKKMIIQIGNDAENILILEQDTGTNCLAYTVQSIFTSNSIKWGRDPTWPPPTVPYNSVPRTVTSFNLSLTGGLTLELDIRDGSMDLQLTSKNGATFTQPVVSIKKLIDRYGGFFLPSIRWDTGAATTVNVLQAAIYVPDQYIPTMTDEEFLPAATLHINKIGYTRMWWPIVNGARFL